MTWKLPATKNLAAVSRAALLVAVAALAVSVIGVSQADAAKRKPVNRAAYSQRGPNVSYNAGPRTRIYVTKRSWLDAGTEVLPGERKFMDYAIPPGQSFGNQNMNRLPTGSRSARITISAAARSSSRSTERFAQS